MKTKPKARRMWANYYCNEMIGIYVERSTAKYFRGLLADPPTPVAVIPLDEPTALGDSMVSALVDLGVLPKQRVKKPKSTRPRHPVEFENAELGDEG